MDGHFPDRSLIYTIFFLVSAQYAILPLCEPEFKHLGSKVYVVCLHSHSQFTLLSTHCLKLLYSTEQSFVLTLQSWTGDNLYKSSTCTDAPISNDS